MNPTKHEAALENAWVVIAATKFSHLLMVLPGMTAVRREKPAHASTERQAPCARTFSSTLLISCRRVANIPVVGGPFFRVWEMGLIRKPTHTLVDGSCPICRKMLVGMMESWISVRFQQASCVPEWGKTDQPWLKRTLTKRETVRVDDLAVATVHSSCASHGARDRTGQYLWDSPSSLRSNPLSLACDRFMFFAPQCAGHIYDRSVTRAGRNLM
jgi:hypothetical protein